MTASVISHSVSAVSWTDHTKASGRAHYGTFYTMALFAKFWVNGIRMNSYHYLVENHRASSTPPWLPL
jgi:hypothetical protein